MRFGMSYVIPHSSPEEWAQTLQDHGFRAANFPVDYHADTALIDAYVKAAAEHDILIAEVGIWSSPWNTDQEEARKSREACLEQLRLAEYVKARCCVNVSGAVGPIWPFIYRENFEPALYDKNVRFIQQLLDTVKPQYTSYTLEPMQWMVPWSVEQYAQMIRDIDRPTFKVHLDPFNFINDPFTYTHQKELLDDCFRMLGSRIVSLHCKDVLHMPGTTVNIQEVKIGTGSFDHAYYLKKVEELGDPDMPVLIEHRDDPQDFYDAIAYLKSLDV
ncbi:MAG: TIM barrel protein [Lachnospiraceae bacterium]|nr:TIM barrel protein [Lachnospiraceae bacterium]